MLYSLLLAGGKSSRMGQDKAALVCKGVSLLERALQLLAKTGSDEILVSGTIDGVESLPDIIPGCGPLGGIHAAFHHIKSAGNLDKSFLLVIPVDMPMLDIDTLSRLVVNTGEADSCHFEDEIFPCVLRASTRFKGHLDQLLLESTALGGKRSMKALLAAFREKRIKTEGLQEHVFLNVNRPEDWDAFRLHLV